MAFNEMKKFNQLVNQIQNEKIHIMNIHEDIAAPNCHFTILTRMKNLDIGLKAQIWC